MSRPRRKHPAYDRPDPVEEFAPRAVQNSMEPELLRAYRDALMHGMGTAQLQSDRSSQEFEDKLVAWTVNKLCDDGEERTTTQIAREIVVHVIGELAARGRRA